MLVTPPLVEDWVDYVQESLGFDPKGVLQLTTPGEQRPKPKIGSFRISAEVTEHDVAGAVLYLISDESKFVTGSEIVVDGGLTAT